MSQYDDIQSISNKDKRGIIEVYSSLIDEPMADDNDYDKAVKSVEQHFHMMTGWSLSLDQIEWYITDWRGY